MTSPAARWLGSDLARTKGRAGRWWEQLRLRQAAPMIRRLTRFAALTPSERRLLTEAVTVQPAIRLALRVAGFRRCHLALSRLAHLSALSGPRTLAAREAIRASQLVRSAERAGLLDQNCLLHSLTLWWLLRRRGIDSDVRIGVRRIGDAIQAHAWVEHSGEALGQDDDVARRFPPLASTSDIVARGRRSRA
jgi:hypothetical protein